MKPAFLWLCASFLAAMSGCSSTSSENVTTAGISADIDVFANGSGSTLVTVELEVGSGVGGTSLELGPSDSLTVVANGIQKTLAEDKSILGRFSYVASFAFDDVDTVFTVSFSRVNGISAPNSNVTMPDGFTVLSPTTANVYAPSENIAIVWLPTGTSNTPSIFVRLDCTLASGLITTATQSVSLSSDTGVAVLPVSSVMPPGTLDTSVLCDGNVDFRRMSSGNLDPNYGEGGQITAEQFERSSFFVDPGA